MSKGMWSGRGSTGKTIGIALMVIGMFLLVFFVPGWIWASVFGVILVSIGFVMWRFLC